MKAWERQLARVVGRLDSVVVSPLAARIDEFIEALLIVAIASWESEAFRRFNDHEVNCAVRVLDHCLRIQKQSREFQVLTLVAEWHQFLPAMLRGEESASNAARPDLRVVLGSSARLVESKRLALRDGLPAAYVIEGMNRFLSGRYVIDGSRAVMIGYLVEEDAGVVVPAINTVIDGQPKMSSADHLRHDRDVTERYHLYRSHHHHMESTLAVEIAHHLAHIGP